MTYNCITLILILLTMEYHGLLNKIILVRPQIDSEKKWTQTQPVDRLGVSPPKMDMIISTIWLFNSLPWIAGNTH